MNESSTAYHAVAAARTRLEGAGFVAINEREPWTIVPGGKYFFTRNGTTIVAIHVGSEYQPENGFTIVAAHTDSPGFRIKPVPCITKSNSLMVNTQPYGGGLWHTWFDRDLGIAGRVLIRNGDSIEGRLVDIRRPVARIPNLAIHLTSGSDRDSFAPNLQNHAKALLSMDPAMLSLPSTNPRFHPALLALLSKELGVDADTIIEMELQLIDVQPSTLGGLSEEFLYSGRLDNLCSSYQALRAIIDSSSETSTAGTVKIAMLFDHEECGSASAQGAGSSLFMDTLKTLNEALVGDRHGSLMRALRKSFIVSADMAHALHPNYSEKHDSSMAPIINGGMVIKYNPNQRYATSGTSAAVFRECARRDGVPVQEFTVRSDSACGR